MAMSTRRINPASLRNLQAYIRDLPTHVASRGSYAIKRGAELFAEALKEAITNQEYASSYQGLNERYELYKIKYGKTRSYPDYWMFDMNLVNAIELQQRGTSGNNRSYVVGFNSDIHERSGKTNAELAEMLELGYGHLPARPVIQPTWDEYGDMIRKEVVRIFSAIRYRNKI